MCVWYNHRSRKQLLKSFPNEKLSFVLGFEEIAHKYVLLKVLIQPSLGYLMMMLTTVAWCLLQYVFLQLLPKRSRGRERESWGYKQSFLVRLNIFERSWDEVGMPWQHYEQQWYWWSLWCLRYLRNCGCGTETYKHATMSLALWDANRSEFKVITRLQYWTTSATFHKMHFNIFIIKHSQSPNQLITRGAFKVFVSDWEKFSKKVVCLKMVI